MAKKSRKSGQKPKPAAKKTTAAKPSETIRTAPKNAFMAFFGKVKTKRESKEATGKAISALIAGAVKEIFLEKTAYALYEKFEKMPDKKLAVVLAHFDHYREIGGLNARATKQGDLFPKVGAPKAAGAAPAKEIPFDPPQPRKSSDGDINQLGRGNNVTSLTNPRSVPSPAVVKQIADRASSRG